MGGVLLQDGQLPDILNVLPPLLCCFSIPPTPGHLLELSWKKTTPACLALLTCVFKYKNQMQLSYKHRSADTNWTVLFISSLNLTVYILIPSRKIFSDVARHFCKQYTNEEVSDICYVMSLESFYLQRDWGIEKYRRLCPLLVSRCLRL